MKKVSGPIRLAMLDDHSIVRYGMTRRFVSEPGLHLVGDYETSHSLIAGLRHAPADVLLLDFALGPEEMDGVSLIRALHARFPGCRILVLSSHYDPSIVAVALRVGARGFIGKAAPVSDIVQAIRTVASGQVYLSGEMVQRLGDAVTSAAPAEADENTCAESLLVRARLSPREREVIRCYLDGMSISGIATKFGRSVKTISTQKSMAYRKLGVGSDQALFKLRLTSGQSK